MIDRSERKAAVSAYKERKPGVYAVRCAATDGQWVGAAPDLSTISTRRSFALWQGVETNRALQSAWNAHGAESFTVKIRYMTQPKARPPYVVLFGNSVDKIPESYKRYLVNGMRETFGLIGVPIRLSMRSGGENPYAPKKRRG